MAATEYVGLSLAALIERFPAPPHTPVLGASDGAARA
jgi:hypothetical protein